MRTPRPLPIALAAGLLLWAGAPLDAQVREMVSSQIAVSDRDASLRLDFSSGESLEIVLREGEVLVDGESLGGYESGSQLEASWRSLLGDAVALDDGPLARALTDWTPPESLEGESAALAARIDETLDRRLAAPEPSAPAEQEDAAPSGEGRGLELADLLRRTDRLEALAEALEDLSLDEVRIRVGEDVEVEDDEEIEATLIVVDGDLDVRGTVDGDVVVTGGTLTVFDGGRITGQARLADARISREGGTVDGPVREIQVGRARALEALEELGNLGGLEDLERLGELDELEEDLRSEIREEIRRELRSELRDEFRDRYRGPDLFSPLRRVGRGLGGLFQNLFGFVLVVALGMVAVHFVPERLERIGDTARRGPARAGLVGIAGLFLLFPAWIIGIVALAVSIIGIPVMIAWIPLFWVAAGLAAAVGYLAVARILGEWIAEQGFRGLDFLRPSNTVHALAAGVAALLIPFAAANVVEMAGPWLGVVEGLLLAVGWIAVAAAGSVGFGAILLSRGGREPRHRPPGEPFGEPDWPADPGPAPSPDEEEWSAQWEDLEREARERASGAAPEETAPEAEEEAPPPDSGSGAGPTSGSDASDTASGEEGDEGEDEDGTRTAPPDA